MPRSVRRTIRTARRRQTKWCASSSVSVIANQGGLAVADAVPLCISTTANADSPDPLVGWCRGSISLSRIGVSEINPAVAWAIVMGRTVPGGVTPLQVFNPFDGDDLERQDILGMGHLPVPATVLIPSSDANRVSREATVTEVAIKVSRRYHRKSNQLFLWLVAAGTEDVAYEATSTIRTLMKFG